jgi:hypothetical protein
LTPGDAVAVELVLDDMAYRVAAGHHLRLALSTTYWPFLTPSPEAATLTLLDGSVSLPVHNGVAADEWMPPLPRAAPESNQRMVTPSHSARRVETDLLTGRVALVVEERSGQTENLDHGLITQENMVERFEINPADPSESRTLCLWDQELTRGGWAVRTHARAEMHTTPDALVFHAVLQAWEGEDLVFEREFSESVPRDFT